VTSFELKRIVAIAIAPLVAMILVLAFYPQFGLSKSQGSVKAAIAPAAFGGCVKAFPGGFRPLSCVEYGPPATAASLKASAVGHPETVAIVPAKTRATR
jgi:hypothetical protein